MYTIYKATNKVNGKVYIGKTSAKLSVRKRQHTSDTYSKNSKTVFHSAIRKHGINNFEWEGKYENA